MFAACKRDDVADGALVILTVPHHAPLRAAAGGGTRTSPFNGELTSYFFAFWYWWVALMLRLK